LPERRCPCLASSDSAQRDSELPSGFQVSGYRSCPGRLGSHRGARVAESRYDFHAAPILAQTLKRRGACMDVLIGVIITFLVVILVLYLVNMLPLDARARQIVRIIVIILGVISLLKYLAVF
jgi:hypothetical protein